MYDCVCGCVCVSAGSISTYTVTKPNRQVAKLPPTPATCVFASPHMSEQHLQHIFHLKHTFPQPECHIFCLWRMFRFLKGPVAWYSGGDKGEKVLPVTTLGIFVMKLFTVLMGTPSVSSWMRVTMSSICRRRSQRKYSSVESR